MHCRVGGRNITDPAGLLAGGQLGPDYIGDLHYSHLRQKHS